MMSDSYGASVGPGYSVEPEPEVSALSGEYPSRDDNEIAAIRDAWRLLSSLDGRGRIRAAAYLVQLAVEIPERDTDGSPEGTDPKGLDGVAATAGAEGIASTLTASNKGGRDGE